MATYCVQGLTWVDDDLEDGYVRVEGNEPRFCMSLATYRALFGVRGGLSRLADTLWDLRGTYLLPRAVIEPEAAEDLLQGLAHVEVEPSETCIYPPCILPATQTHVDGFRLCDTHADLLRTWDDLVA